MSAFDECGVLIPAATLEDFPTDLSDYDARSLLAGWTVLWHPRLLSAGQTVPTWYRADDPPEPGPARILTVPHPSLRQLPSGYEERFRHAGGGAWITGENRQQMLEALELGADPKPLQWGSRTLEVADFFAAGFAVLQIQVMTRRLRYTSNLDEIHLQNRVVAAASAFLDGEAQTAIEAMHDVFDCLAEERDHYFSSDPHLIDLTLLTESLLAGFVSDAGGGDCDAGGGDCDAGSGDEEPASATTSAKADDPLANVAARSPNASEPDAAEPNAAEPNAAEPNAAEPDAAEPDAAPDTAASMRGGQPTPPLPTPRNVLLDQGVAAGVADLEKSLGEQLRTLLAGRRWGWAGGGPPSEVCLDAMTYLQAEAAMRAAYRLTGEAVGTPPAVYGRFSGSTPSDMTAILAELGYVGVIPLDFAGGTGYGDEAKVILRAAGVEIESLTAKPIDASQDSSFLNLGARLGESIDSGEIATALLVHWPGHSCDSHQDLRRVASWSLALGRFWKLDEYFQEGEHPYHHGSGRAASPDAPRTLSQQVEMGVDAPLSQLASAFRQAVTAEVDAKLSGLTQLLAEPDKQEPSAAFAAAVGMKSDPQQKALLLANPHSVGCRVTVPVAGGVSSAAEHIYQVSAEGKQSMVTVDVPASGFVMLDGHQAKPPQPSLLKRIGIGRPTRIAEQQHLMNEFMEVTISSESGGVSAAYSGSARGNRFSMRLVGCRAGKSTATMKCRSLRVAESSTAVGRIVTSGDLVDERDHVLAEFELTYTLERGSRVLGVIGTLTPKTELGADPWQDYLAARVAVANESVITRLLLRDKVHRSHGRRIVAPLGVVLDEAERQTLISGGGLPCHVRVGDRFVDTLLAVRGETSPRFQLDYGFDISSPVELARTRITPPRQIAVTSNDKVAAVGWLAHVAPKEVVISQLTTRRRSDGRLVALVRVMQTRPASCTATLRFVHEIDAAMKVTHTEDDLFDQTIADPPIDTGLKVSAERISLPLAAHEVTDLLVVFRSIGRRRLC